MKQARPLSRTPETHCNAMVNAAMTTCIIGIICINFRTRGFRGNNHGRQSRGTTEQLRTSQDMSKDTSKDLKNHS